jgi:hypothetical protein
MRYKELAPSLQLTDAHMPSAFRKATASVCNARHELQLCVRRFEAALHLSRHSAEIVSELRVACASVRAAVQERTDALIRAEKKLAQDEKVQLFWQKFAAREASAAVREFCGALHHVCIAVERTKELFMAVDRVSLRELDRLVHEEYFPQSLLHGKEHDPIVLEFAESSDSLHVRELTEGTLQTMVEVDEQLYDLLRPAELRWLRISAAR